MSAEQKKIDISNWNGPMTVVGYPDLSAVKYLSRSEEGTEKHAITVKIPAEQINKQPKHHA